MTVDFTARREPPAMTLADEIRRLRTVAAAHVFHARLKSEGVEMNSATWAAFLTRIDALRKAEANPWESA